MCGGRHRDYYTALAAELDAPARSGNDRRLAQVAVEIDNLRAAGSWSRENGDVELALQLASSLQPLWLARARIREGLTWFDAVEAGETTSGGEVAPMVRARALADQALLNAWAGDTNTLEQAEQAVAIALEIDDSALLARAMSARSCISFWIPGVARLGFEAPIELARGLADQWRLSQLFGWQALAEFIAGDPIAGRAAGEEGRAIADAIDDRFHSRQCRVWLGWALMMAGDLAGAAAELRGVIAEAELAHDSLFCVIGGISLGHLLAYQGDTSTACTVAQG